MNIRNIPAIETLLACSLGLVTVEKSSSTVRLVHYTLQEYLSNNPNLFLEPHSLIAEVCLTYLNFRHVMGFSPTLRSVPPTAPFTEYASCYWGTHYRRGSTGKVKTLALKLLDGYDKHISSKILLLRGTDIRDRPFDRQGTPRGFTGLHSAAYLGCVEIVVALLETNQWDVQATDFHGNTAIIWAARRGHEGVVQVLLERKDVNPNTPNNEYGQTPLSWATKNGYEGVVKMLLGHNGINPDKPDTYYGQTPLSWAAENGHEGVVRMLLGRNGVNPDLADKWSRTPLLRATENGHEGVVRTLLERDDVNPGKADSWSRKPLSWALEKGHDRIAKLLRERAHLIPKYAASLQSTELFSEPSEPSEPPSKRTRMF